MPTVVRHIVRFVRYFANMQEPLAISVGNAYLSEPSKLFVATDVALRRPVPVKINPMATGGNVNHFRHTCNH
ncbi:MAG TPA: hypothetical protein VI756_11810, partial [Blastocatellia bacterium]